MALRPRLLLNVAEPDRPDLILQRADRTEAPSFDAVASNVEDMGAGHRAARIGALQGQGVTVRLGDIKEEARARR